MNHIEVMKQDQIIDAVASAASRPSQKRNEINDVASKIAVLGPAIEQAEQAQPSDGGHSAAQCDEATCPLCEQHYPEIAAAARQAAKLAKPVVSIDTSQERVEKPHANEHEQAQPVAWTLTETLNKRETTTRGHLWFSDPQNCMWTALYTAPPQRLPLTDEQSKLAAEAVNQIMDQAQVFASAWSLVGGRFDFGEAMEDAEQAKAELQIMVESLAREAAHGIKGEA